MEIFNSSIFRKLRDALDQREAGLLGPRAVKNSHAIRRVQEPRLASDYRPPFSVDGDRILHSLAYTRYIDKTQVFSLTPNDHITHRVLHVQLVSKIARTIGRFLGLNVDLIEAIALGHDLGHPPFGHEGEHYLSQLCLENHIGHFRHCAQSVQFISRVERKGRGWNLCLQTLDGILCHDGEVHDPVLTPQWEKDFTIHDEEAQKKIAEPDACLVPMTLEGCVVRVSDTIGYIGRDIEDAIRLGLIQRSDIPSDCAEVLGTTNGTIVYRLVTDIITNSMDKPFIAFSESVSQALHRLKRFNLERIYLHPITRKNADIIGSLYRILFEQFMEDVEAHHRDSPVFSGFLKGMAPEYMANHCAAEIVRDFIAGMTDQYFLSLCPERITQRLVPFTGRPSLDDTNRP